MRKSATLFSLLLCSSVAWAATDPTECQVEISSWKGAYYRKIRSEEMFAGVTGTIRIPTFKEDPARTLKVSRSNLRNRPDWDGPLDRASNYVGGQSGEFELDVGVDWDQVFTDKGARVLVSKSVQTWDAKIDSKNWYRLFEKIESAQSATQPWKEAITPTLVDPAGVTVATGREDIRTYIEKNSLSYLFTFKPFIRMTNSFFRETFDSVETKTVWDDFEARNRTATIYTIGDSVLVNGNIVHRTDQWYSDSPYMYVPGEDVQMSLTHNGNAFTLKLLSSRTHELAWFRFYQQGFERNSNSYSFKRVSSIDQYKLVGGVRSGNEGANVKVIDTAANVLGGGWLNFFVLNRQVNGYLKIPLARENCINTRGVDLASFYFDTFRIQDIDNDLGREMTDIVPTFR